MTRTSGRKRTERTFLSQSPVRNFALFTARGTRDKITAKRKKRKVSFSKSELPICRTPSTEPGSGLVSQAAKDAVKRRVDIATAVDNSPSSASPRASPSSQNRVTLIAEIAAETTELCSGEPVVCAGVADALLSHPLISASSSEARKRVVRRKAQKSQRKTKAQMKRELVNEQHEFQRRKAWITCFSSLGTSTAEFQRMRMKLSFESVVDAKQRPHKRKLRFKPWHKPENSNQRTLVVTRTKTALGAISTQWETDNVAEDFNFNFMVEGGWNRLGIHDDVDEILANIDTPPSKISPRMRGQFLKEMLQESGSVQSTFFERSTEVTRRAYAVMPSISPTLTSHAENQMKFIEKDTRNFISVDGRTFTAPHEDSNTKENPTKGLYNGEDVLFTPVKERVLEFISRRFHGGEMSLLIWSKVKVWSFQYLFEVLSDAGFPLVELAKLIPLSIDAFRRFVYRSMNTVFLGDYGDNAALRETWPTFAYYKSILYVPYQWNADLSEEKLEEICLEMSKPGVDIFGRANSTAEDTGQVLSLSSRDFWSQPENGYPVRCPENHITCDEIAALERSTSIQYQHDDSDVPHVWLQPRLTISDIEHAQGAIGITQGGKGKYNSPHLVGSQTELRDPSTCLLLAFRTYKSCMLAYGIGPDGDQSRAYSDLPAAVWKKEYSARIGGPIPPKAIDAENAVKEVLQGVTRRSGYFPPFQGTPPTGESPPTSVYGAKLGPGTPNGVFHPGSMPGDALPDGVRRFSDGGLQRSVTVHHPVWTYGPRGGDGDITNFPDSMHNLAGVMHHVYDMTRLRQSPTNRGKLDVVLRQRGVLKKKMRCRDWAYLTVFVCSPASQLDGVILSESQVALARSLADLRSHLYTRIHTKRSRGHVLSVFCVVCEVVFGLETAFPRGGSFAKSGPSEDALYGLYLSGLIVLGIVTRLTNTMIGNCEHGESLFKPIKRIVITRSNNHWDDTVRVLRRCLLAYSVDSATNRTDSDSKDDEERIGLLYEELKLGPQTMGSRGGEIRHITKEMVRTRFFVLMWIRWLPDYLVGGGWWDDDDCGFVDDVRGTTIYCDYSVNSRASLFDIAWSTEVDLERILLLDTVKIFTLPEQYSIPGWRSVKSALSFLKSNNGSSDDVFEKKLGLFLRDVDARVEASRTRG